MTKFLFSVLSVVFSTSLLFCQSPEIQAERHIKANLESHDLINSDIENWYVSDNYVSKHNGINHIYYQQTYQGVSVLDAIININVLQDNSVLSWNSRFVPHLHQKVRGIESVSSAQAAETSLSSLGLTQKKALQKISESTSPSKETEFKANELIDQNIKTKLIYLQSEKDEVQLCWVSYINTIAPEFHMWSVYVDASSGKVIKIYDGVLTCSFGENPQECRTYHNHKADREVISKSQEESFSTNMYNVFPIGVESPIHGDRTIVTDPAETIGSPFGWHDTNGIAGAEFTITRGNNVLSQDDINGNNGSGYSPDGGTDLIFDFTLDFGESPATNTPEAQNLNSSLTNLFYWNNIIHDVFYQYGFDEPSGNFQENNYGNGGQGGDYVFADGLDGSGSNNANFGTPTDGGNPRMQMFLWNTSGSGTTSFEVNAPGNVSGTYTSVPAAFSPDDYLITGDVVEVTDGTANPTEGCSPLTNGTALAGNIALVDRGNCTFVTKVENAEDAGAIAVIVCNNVPGNPITMSGSSSAAIPAVMISQADCTVLRAELGSLNVTLESLPAPDQIDGSFDNGIIAHEYGHGISIRLTGGPGTSSCLTNAEQAGEGWSDFFGLVLSHQAGDTAGMPRPIGTYALNQPASGGGIRTYPYTTDMSINPFTYDDIKTQSVPHGVGSVFCTILWDMYWDLTDEYGYDPDIYNGTGGNNIALQLVIDGLKMQPCSPGFIDARDAILAADIANNDGANQCIIWNAFARRGVGLSATQGSSGSRSDGVEAFDVPAGVFIKDVEVATIEALEGEIMEITGTAACNCQAESDVILKHTIPAGMTLLSVENGNIVGTEVVSDLTSLMPDEEMTISYTVRVDICNSQSSGNLEKEVTINGIESDSEASLINYNKLTQANIFVDKVATGKSHGGNWADAFTSLQEAMEAAECNTNVSELWVKAGTYKPALEDQSQSFSLVNGLAIYGGFAGTETLLNERDFGTNLSVLSGDLGVVGDPSDNSFQVISNTAIDATAILDGFTITGGYNETLDGGGILNVHASPIIKNCIITENTALRGGGVANILDSSVFFENCTFTNNNSISTLGRSVYTNDAMTTLRGVIINDSLIGTTGSTIENEGPNAILVTEGSLEIKE